MTNKNQEDLERLKKDNAGIKEMLDDHDKNKNKYLLFQAVFVTVALTGAILIFANMPKFKPEEFEVIMTFPPTIQSVKQVTEIFKVYSTNNPTWVFVAWGYMYMFFQTFAIPLAVFLSLMGGPLFGFTWAFTFIAIFATFGSSCCYLLSQTLLKGFIIHRYPAALYKLCQKVKEQQGNLFFQMIFLRQTPIIPNFVVNLGSPIAGIPLFWFALGTFAGLMPMNFIHVSTGQTIGEASSSGLSPKTLAIFACISFAALIPIYLGQKAKKDDEKKDR